MRNNDSIERANRIISGTFRKAVLAVVLLIGLIVFGGTIVVTDPDEFTVVRQFGRIVQVNTEPGVTFKTPLIQSATSMPKASQYFDIPVTDIITLDKQNMIVDMFATWHIVDPETFITALNGSLTAAEVRIGNLAYNVSKNAFSTMTQADIITNRATLAKQFQESFAEELKHYGVELQVIETKRLDLPDDNKNAVYQRMISERGNIATEHRSDGESDARIIRNTADKNAQVRLSEAETTAARLISEGEAEYMRLLSDVYNDAEMAEFYKYIRSLDAMLAAYEGTNTTIILDSSSPMARLYFEMNP